MSDSWYVVASPATAFHHVAWHWPHCIPNMLHHAALDALPASMHYCVHHVHTCLVDNVDCVGAFGDVGFVAPWLGEFIFDRAA